MSYREHLVDRCDRCLVEAELFKDWTVPAECPHTRLVARHRLRIVEGSRRGFRAHGATLLSAVRRRATVA